MVRRLLVPLAMVENECDPIEVPLDLCCPKTDSGDAEPLQLLRTKPTKQPAQPPLPLDVEVSFWSESCFYSGLNGKASQAGLFVATYRPIQRGERVLLRFELFGERVEIEGQVQWRRGASEHISPGVGVAFRDISSNAQALIDFFCTKRAPLYYEVDPEAT